MRPFALLNRVYLRVCLPSIISEVPLIRRFVKINAQWHTKSSTIFVDLPNLTQNVRLPRDLAFPQPLFHTNHILRILCTVPYSCDNGMNRSATKTASKGLRLLILTFLSILNFSLSQINILKLLTLKRQTPTKPLQIKLLPNPNMLPRERHSDIRAHRLISLIIPLVLRQTISTLLSNKRSPRLRIFR